MRLMRLRLAVAAGLSLSAVSGVLADDDVLVPPGSKKVKVDVPKQEFELPKGGPTRPTTQPGTTSAGETGKPAEGAAAQVQVFKAVEIAPERPLVVFHFPDITRMARASENSPFGRLMSEEVLGRFWQTAVLGSVRRLPPATKGMPSGAGIADVFGRMQELCRGEAVLAVYTPAADAAGGVPRLLCVLEMDENRRALFQDSLPQMREWAGLTEEAGTTSVKAGDFEYDKLTQRKRTVLCYGFVGGHLVIASDAGLYEEVLRAAKAKGERSLARDSEWNAACARLGSDADLYFKVGLSGVPEALAAGVADEANKALAVRLRGLRYVSGGLSFQAGAVRERFYVHMDKDSELFGMLGKKGPNRAMAKLIPLDACYFDLQRAEKGAALESFRWVKLTTPSGKQDGFETTLNRVFEKSGLDLEKDVLPALSGSMAQAIVLSGMGPAMDFDMLLVIEPDDEELFRKVLNGLDSASAKEFSSEAYMGSQLRFWSPPEKEEDAGESIILPKQLAGMPWMRKLLDMDQCPLGPIRAYAVSGRYAIFGTSARIVKLAVRQTDPVGMSSCIEDKPDFKEARDAVGQVPNEVRLSYVDLRRVSEVLFAMGGGAGMTENLPSLDKVVERLGGLLVSVRSEESGVTAEVCSPVGLMPLTGAGALVIYVKAMDSMAEAEAKRHTEKLKAVWRGMENFATDFNRYPLKPSELFRMYVEDNTCFLTPDQEAADVPVKIETADDLNTKSGYAYVSGCSPNSAANTLIMYSVRPDSRGRYWCLFTSGTVSPVVHDGLMELLGRDRE